MSLNNKENAESSQLKPTTSQTGFRLGNLARSLLAQAQYYESNITSPPPTTTDTTNNNTSCLLNPNELKDLLNPMRTQFGLPSLAAATTPTESTIESSDTTKTTQLLTIPNNIAAETKELESQELSLSKITDHNIAAVIKNNNNSVNKKKPKKVTSSGWKFSTEKLGAKEYLIIDVLGKGGSGEVSLVIEKSSRKRYALKRINLQGVADSNIEECINEVEMLVELKESDLVAHIYAWEFNKQEKTMKILMEEGYCDLNQSIIKERNKQVDLLEIKWIWKRLLNITNFIHQRGIVHSDLKPANFIWVGKNLKIIDFGIASRLQQDKTSIQMICPKGTLNFISPETIVPDSITGIPKISTKSDIWSLGCILYMLLLRKTPFDHLTNPMSKMDAIVNNRIDYSKINDLNALNVLKLCFQLDYKFRPTAEELLHHAFLK